MAVGRRTILGLSALGALGIAFGASIQNFLGNAFGSGLGGLLPGGDRFRIYTITGTLPKIKDRDYRLKVSGLVAHPKTFTLADLQAMPVTSFTKAFQCVTGWRVPNVAWEGVLLSDLLSTVGVKPEAVALTFESYDRADTESLTLRCADVRLQITEVALGHSRRQHRPTGLLGEQRLPRQRLARRLDRPDQSRSQADVAHDHHPNNEVSDTNSPL